jgi:hypothetical protein
MQETPLLFGPESNLVGVLTQPPVGTLPPMAFVLFNAGVIPRMGMHRFNVKLSRALALQGQVTLRFDIAGLGDSRNPVKPGDTRSQAVLDLQAAMDVVERRLGIRRFALVGMCSGAVNSFWTALADERVSAVLMFDGFWYHSLWSVPVCLWKRWHSLTWHDRISQIVRRLKRRLKALVAPKNTDPASPSLYAAYGNPPREEYVRNLQAIVDRGTSMYLVFSGDVLDEYSYAAQFRHAFARERFVNQVRCDFRTDIDHTFITTDIQQRMISLVLDWVPGVRRASEAHQ